MYLLIAFSCLFYLHSYHGVHADTPANCSYNDLVGTWLFHFSSGGNDKNIDCTTLGPIQAVIPMTFYGFNNVVKETDKEMGTFNLIYNQGFEVVLGYRKLFAFFKYKSLLKNESDIYWCNETMNGWSHDNLGNDWACFVAVRQPSKLPRDETKQPPSEILFKQPKLLESMLAATPFKTERSYIGMLNKAQSSWKAVEYPKWERLSYAQVLARAGYSNSRLVRAPTRRGAPKSRPAKYVLAKYPETFDWRNVDGVSYVSPVRHQDNCGSCYAFASMGMLEARLRIITNNSQTPVFSPQEVVSCSRYAQGCEGGFPYLIAGKHGQDFGVVEERCFPYVGKDTACSPDPSCARRTYTATYEYVGGYYGGCTEEEMIRALVTNGPITVAIQVYQDFINYKSGVYHHVTSVPDPRRLRSVVGFNPFEKTDHAVLLVGYGVEPATGEKYWIVKNSWGADWGERGYVRVRRGTDEIAIESLAMQATPIPQL